MTPQDIADLLQREGSGSQEEDYDETLESESVVQRRTELLADVLKTCTELLRTSDVGQLEEVAEKLGDGSRDEAWRLPYGDSGILSFFLQQLGREDITNKLKIHSLRIVGNTCADTTKNRALLVEEKGMETIINQLHDETVVQYTIPVLYNVMVEYEPAQSLASELKISQAMMKLLASPSLPKSMGVILYFCRILALLVTNDSEVAAAAHDTVSVLLSVAINTPCRDDLEEFASLGSVAVAYLAADRFQQLAIATDHQIGLFLDVFYHAHVGFDLDTEDDPDLASALKQLRLSLLNMVAELTGQDAFAATYPLTSSPVQSLLSWLRGSSNAQLQAAACLALGNVSRSDEACTALVDDYAVHTPLAALLANPAVTDTQLLHSALSCLKNLAIPTHNRPALGAALLAPRCVPRIYGVDAQPQVQYAAVSLTRLLVSGCPDNVGIFCRNHGGTATITSEEEEETTTSTTTSVDDLISLFGRTDTEPTRVEAARTIAAICRVLHSDAAAELLLPRGADDASSLSSSSDSECRAAFYSRHDVGAPLAFLVAQEKWPVLRSEAWFVLALMSRSVDGARVIAAVVRRDDVSARLAEVITGQKRKEPEEEEEEGAGAAKVSGPGGEEDEDVGTALSAAEGLGLEPQQADPKQKEHIAAVERENALVMCTELLRNWSDEFTPLSRGFLEGLLKQGTELVVARRNRESS